MKIAFLTFTGWAFLGSTPRERPFGGTESAVCYLSQALACAGHEVTVFNGNSSSCVEDNVRFSNLRNAMEPKALNHYDAVVAVNMANSYALRKATSINAPLICWTQHANDQGAVQDLRYRHQQDGWNHFVFVSEWQRKSYSDLFRVPDDKSFVLRNAASPAFLEQTLIDPWNDDNFIPTLAYTSTPFRGLDVLLDAFPRIRQAVPKVRLRIFSSMAVYQVDKIRDNYQDLYNKAINTEGVEYVGSIGQANLAQELAGLTALAYPSTFAETSCISIIEAMATGARTFTTRLGALQETAGNYGDFIDWQPNKEKLSENFSSFVISNLRAIGNDLKSEKAQRDSRRRYVEKNYSWEMRANEWIQFLQRFL